MLLTTVLLCVMDSCGGVRTTLEFFKTEPGPNLFANIQDICQILPKVCSETVFMKKSCHKEVI